MSKVFGYTQRGGQHWFRSDAYFDKEIEAIKDPAGGGSIDMPTAIPSPFARIDLVKTAFRNIGCTPELKQYTKDGNVVAGRYDEKLVSHTLDLAEMLFNIDGVRDKVEIVVWDREKELTLLKTGSDAHRGYGEALELYLKQDADAYNFDQLRRLYLIKYDHKVIGCTSPATLFFPTANNLEHARINLTKNSHTLFGARHMPLHERDREFQKYLHLLFRSNNVLRDRMRDLDGYLKKSLTLLQTKDPALHDEIQRTDLGALSKRYDQLDTNTQGEVVEVLGVTLLKQRRANQVESVKASDFVIRATKAPPGHWPLVLQNRLNKPFRYVNDAWDNATQVPYIDPTPIQDRKLPGVQVKYPYLTVSDFLEPHLIRLVYPLDRDRYFDGAKTDETDNSAEKGYLLPLKNIFFDYFTIGDLGSGGPSGRPMIRMERGVANSVKVTLWIPIAKQDEHIAFERIYYEQDKPDEKENKGVVREHQFGITLYPFIKTGKPEIPAHYRVQLVDREVLGSLMHAEYDLTFHADGSALSEVPVTARKMRTRKTPGAVETATSQYYVLKQEFDLIRVNMKGADASGIIIPLWPPFMQGTKRFSFAVDFGTTNTHVEYKMDDGPVKPFDVTPQDVQVATLHQPSKDAEDMIRKEGVLAILDRLEHEFVPQLLGKGAEYKFPHRTVISESHTLNIGAETSFALADFNIPFIYERKEQKGHDRIKSNLKWAKKDEASEIRVRAFFEELLMLLRNKVLLNQGDLSQTRLVWFYPSSMTPGRIDRLREAWGDLVQQHLGGSVVPVSMTESLAPFYFFKARNELQGGAYKPVVSIDIGGGTTDAVVFKSNEPLLLTSFKFAANTLFGDGFSEHGAADSNGLARKFLPHYTRLLDANKVELGDLLQVLSSIRDKNRSADLNAFLFAIENSPKVKDQELFSYNRVLSKDEDLKIVFIYFYAAIVYHIANLMKSKGVDLPKHLVFSGTGSKVLRIISPNKDLLADFAKRIFEEVYGRAFDQDGLTVVTEDKAPKEVTCRGGLMSKPEELLSDIRQIKVVHNQGMHTYADLNEHSKDAIVQEVQRFNAFFLGLNEKIGFRDHFNVSAGALELFKNEANKHLRDYLEDGIGYNKRLDEVASDSEPLADPLFFLPMIGTINHLLSKLASLNSGSQ
jgi:hypothetical protein